MDEFVYDLTYNDILKIPSPYRDKVIETFNKLLEDVPDEIYSDSKTLGEMLMEASFYEEENISNYFFSGEKVIFYPNVRFVKSRIKYTCPVSGVRCNPGEEAVLYKPFLYLPGRKSCYVLAKTIRANYYYEDFFPRKLNSFEDFCYKVEHSYELELEAYYNFLCNNGSLTLKKLK